MDSISVLADSETLLGFRLAGVRNVFTLKEDVDASVNAALDAEGHGIIVITNDIVEKASSKTKKRIENTTKPVVVVIPGKSAKDVGKTDDLAALVKRAMGVELR
ncbi:hypothetical protein HZC09_00915 [Candidatus Micrarchaeota archaeon]|nr:hypothetical protein [Candidatus Micrarchaeota archaeon]